MPVTFCCPTCAFSGTVPDSYVGRFATCPKCKERFRIADTEEFAAQVLRDEPVAPALQSAPQRIPCPFCSEEILATAKKCKHCGEMIDPALRPSREQAEPAPVRPIVVPPAKERSAFATGFGVMLGILAALVAFSLAWVFCCGSSLVSIIGGASRPAPAPPKADPPPVVTAPAEPPPAKGDDAIDFKHGASIEIGNALVSIRPTIGKVKVKEKIGDGGWFDDPEVSLKVLVLITPAQQNRKVDYSTWAGKFLDNASVATAVDSVGNVYKRMNYGIAYQVRGREESLSVYPGKTETDLLVFEQPVSGAEFFILTLPAKNVGGKGTVKVKIRLPDVQRE